VDYLEKDVQVFLDAGNSPKGEASTILDLTAITPENPDGKIRIVRLGALKKAQIKSVVGGQLADDK